MTGNDQTAADQGQQRCGYAAVLGIPNAGKSTLTNALVGAKVTIVSPKVQTTRNRVLGIAMAGQAQIILMDTPGIFSNPKRRLERAMVQAAWTGAGDADVLCVLVDAQKGYDSETKSIIDGLKDRKQPKFLVLNKIDLVAKERLLLLLAAEGNALLSFDQTFMVSAEKGDGVADLLAALAKAMPASPWFYPDDQVADMPLRLMAAEFTREQLFRRLHQELPYHLTVDTESWQDKDDGSVRIEQVITVAREGHRPIVLGKGGQLIKQVGAAARRDLMEVLDRPVHLFLHVKVREDWLEDPRRYRDMGLDYDS